MTKDEKAAKLLRIFPVLKGAKQKKAFTWLKANGYLRGSLPPNTQTFTVEGPPGRGRLERVPMSLELLGSSGEGLGYYNPNVITDGGAGAAAVNNSVTMVNMPINQPPVLNQYDSTISGDQTFGHYTITAMTFSTRQTQWAKLRVVGIETVLNYTPMVPLIMAGDAATVSRGVGLASPPRLLMKNYRVSGSANLFIQDGYIDGTFFDVERLLLGGLRAYPILESPNTLKVDVALIGEHYHGSLAVGFIGIPTTFFINGVGFIGGTCVIPYSTDYTFSVNAIVEVLDDTSYGKSLPGPSSRGLNLVRTPPKRGQSFIIGE